MKKYYETVFNAATGKPLTGAQVQVLDSNGDLASIYSDENGTVAANPIGVNGQDSSAPGYFEFFAESGFYTIKYLYGGNEIWSIADVDISTDLTEAQAAAETGAGMIGFSAGADATPSTVQTEIRNLGVSVKQYGAKGDHGTDDTAAIQAAIDTGSKYIYFPEGSYMAAGLTTATDGQILVGLGEVNIFRNDDGELFSSSAADLQFHNIVFWGQSASYSGDLVVLSGLRNQLWACACRDAGDDRVLWMKGSRSKILGDRDGYYGNVQIGEAGSVCLYYHIESVSVSGVLTLVESGHGAVFGGVTLGITVDPGDSGFGSHGPKIIGTRIVGALIVEQTSTYIGSGTTVAGDITIGDGDNVISSITVAPGVEQIAGKTFTINAMVSDSQFFLGGIPSSNTVTVSSPVNEIWDRGRRYTPTLTASGGSPAIGNGSISGTIYRSGFERRVAIQLSCGSTTDIGSGETRVSVPDTCGALDYGHGIARVLDSGVGHKPIKTEIAPNKAYLTMYSDTTAGALGGDTLDKTFPITFANGDAIVGSVTYSVV